MTLRLGLIGAGGIGFYIQNYLRTLNYPAASTVLLVLIALVAVELLPGGERPRIGPVDEEGSVQVIHLMLDHPRMKSIDSAINGRAVLIESLITQPVVPGHEPAHTRYAEAPFPAHFALVAEREKLVSRIEQLQAGGDTSGETTTVRSSRMSAGSW